MAPTPCPPRLLLPALAQYRLCPLGSKLDEECFQKTPLAFEGNSSLRFGGKGGERVYFNTTARGWETRGAEGGIWRKNPIPRGPWDWRAYGPSFEPVCANSASCANGKIRNPGGINPCKCAGSGLCALPGKLESNCADFPQMEVVDTVRVPAGLPAGDYVLGWRWDCEESTQIWSSCADITIKAK